MSYTEYHKGKLKRVDLSKYDNSTEKYFEEQCRKVLIKFTEEDFQKLYKDTKQYLKDYRPEKLPNVWQFIYQYYEAHPVISVNDQIFEVEDDEFENDTTMISQISDDEFEYYTSFYNGGTYLEEILTESLNEKLK